MQWFLPGPDAADLPSDTREGLYKRLDVPVAADDWVNKFGVPEQTSSKEGFMYGVYIYMYDYIIMLIYNCFLYIYTHVVHVDESEKPYPVHTQMMTRSRNFPHRPVGARCFRGCIEVQSGCRTQCTTFVGSAGLK